MTTHTFQRIDAPVVFDSRIPASPKFPYIFKLDHVWTIFHAGTKALPRKCAIKGCATCGGQE